MLELSDALAIVDGKLTEMAPKEEPYVVLSEQTIERPFGWIFFYNSKTFVETASALHRLAGNGPVFVNRFTGSIDFFGSAQDIDTVVAKYERALGGTDEHIC